MEASSDPKVLTSQFLWNSALKLSSGPQKSLLPIISQLRESCAFLARAGVQDSSFQSSEACEHCGNPWSEGSFKVKILYHSQKMKKLKKRLLMNSNWSSKFNKNLTNLFSKRKDNVMARMCCICTKTTKIGLRKPLVQNSAEEESSLVVGSQFTAKKKKKRKSKKDSFSGLIPTAVVNARLSLLSRDSISGSPRCSSVISESILSDETLQIVSNLENSPSETKSLGPTYNIALKNESKTIGSYKTAKKHKLDPEFSKNQNPKKHKKKKKSSISDFLKLL